MKFVLFCAGVLALATPLHAQNLLKNGDFEAETSAVPIGWAMWGKDQWKTTANYTRDTTQAHSGTASLRIFHPANTGGYLAAEPQTNGLETARDMVYTLDFWAKSDTPGAAQLTVFGLQSLQPLVGETVFGSKIEATTAWKRFEFRLAEGFDFDADKIHRLQLAFNATSYDAPNAEKTLWLDDIELTARPALVQARTLLDINSIAYAPVEHRLQPGDALNITVDAAQKLRRATREAEGASFHRLQGYMGLPYDAQGNYQLSEAQETAIRDMRPAHTRIYGLGDEKFSLNQAIDNAAHVLERTSIPQDSTVLELEDQHAERKLTPQQWVKGIKYSQQKGYKFRFWEVSNEPYIPYQGRREIFKTSEDYIAHFKAVAPAIRAAQPDAQIGVQIFGIAGKPAERLQWSNAVLKATAGNYDFVCAHWYSLIDVNKNSFETVVAAENYRVLDQIARTNALLKAYNPGRDVYQYDTEWSLYSFANQGDVIGTPQNGNIVGALHRAIRLIYYVREDLVRGASAWEMFSGRDRWNALALLPPEGDKTSMNYWVHRTFSQYTGQWALQMSGTAPYYTPPADAGTPTQRPLAGPLTPAISMLSSDEKTLTLIVANASWSKEVPLSLQLKNFKAASVTGQKLSNDDPNRSGLLDKKEEFVSDFTAKIDGTNASGTSVSTLLPPHSVVFLSFKK